MIKRLGEQYTLVGLDRAGPPDPPPPAQTVDFDLSSDEAVKAALDEVRRLFGPRIASVIHLAAYYDVSGEPNPLYDKITVQGTRRLIDALQAFEVEQFVFASTMLVHKPTDRPDATISEDSPVEAAWAYPDPEPAFDGLRDHMAFYAGPMDACYVDEEQVTPQPGGFYGGWITGNIVGPFKGDPEH